jgi:methylthioribulose-1-phosphate dehydratase
VIEVLSSESQAMREALVALGRRYLAAGWVFGTAGNLSGRVADRAVVTASGRHLGDLTTDDFVEVALDGTLTHAAPGDRPSAEASIHLALYRALPEVKCGLHVHTVASTLLQADDHPVEPGTPSHVVFSGLEMIKGWGLWDPDAIARLPLFDNHASVPQIARDVERYYGNTQNSAFVPALAISGHGLTAWGASAFAANRHLEVAEFLCQIAHARG